MHAIKCSIGIRLYRSKIVHLYNNCLWIGRYVDRYAYRGTIGIPGIELLIGGIWDIFKIETITHQRSDLWIYVEWDLGNRLLFYTKSIESFYGRIQICNVSWKVSLCSVSCCCNRDGSITVYGDHYNKRVCTNGMAIGYSCSTYLGRLCSIFSTIWKYQHISLPAVWVL